MTPARYAGFWRRAAAYAVDTALLYLISFFLFLVIVLAGGLDLPAPRRLSAPDAFDTLVVRGMALYWLAATVANLCYFTYFHGSTGQTPGKMLMKVQVIQISGEPMTFGLAFLRWVGYIVSGIFLYLGFLWVAWDGRKQAWHDKIAGTLVVHRTPQPVAGEEKA